MKAEYANWKSGQVESLVILWVRLPLRSLNDEPDTRAAGPMGGHLGRNQKIGVQLPGGPLTPQHGLMVQRHDTAMA